MNILFLTLIDINDVEVRGIYTDLMRHFAHNGHHVTIFSPLERRFKTCTIAESANVSIVKFKTLNIQKVGYVEKVLSTLSIDFLLERKLRKWSLGQKVDLLIYSTPPITWTRSLKFIKEKFSCKSYLLLKDMFPQCLLDLNVLSKANPFYRLLEYKEKRIYALSDVIGCMSQANVDFVLKNNKLNDNKIVEICPNSLTPIKTRSNNFIREKYNISAERKIVLFGGNLGKPQAIDFLLEILYSNIDNQKVQFIIIGSGTESAKLENWLSLNSSPNAIYVGSVDKKNYDKLIGGSDIGLILLDKRFTVPNFPSRILSYMENEMSVLLATDTSTDIGQIAEENNFGFWSTTGDIDSFNFNLNRFLVMPEEEFLEYGKLAKKFYLENYTTQHAYDIIMSHFIE